MTDSTSLPITATPAAGQRIAHDGKEFTTIKEGLAHILIPATAATVPQTAPTGEHTAQSVFYNPIQQFNRDLSVLAIKAYGEQVTEKKRADMEKRYQALTAKKNNKRKREDTIGSDESRKAGKLDEKSTATEGVQATSTESTAEATTNGDDAKVADEVPNNESSEAVGTEKNAENSKDAVESASKTPQPTFTILDALSATGLRALRYAQEIPFTTSVTANDLLAEATKSIELNVAHNKLEGKITAVTGNALAHMYSLACEAPDTRGRSKPSKKYDVIDLDPYGTAAPFLDAAVQSVRDDGGLLCITCTDAGVWASNGYPEKCYSLYGGVPLKGIHSHEGGLRIILHSIATSAAKYGLTIEPLLSLSIDFYARVFVRVRKSPAEVKFLAGKTMLVYNCDSGCGAWSTQMLAKNKLAPNKNGKGTFYKYVLTSAPSADPHCEHCGTKTHLAGPMYGGPIHSPDFIKRILADLPNVSKDTYQTTARIEGMLTMAMEENMAPLEAQTMELPAGYGKNGDPAAIDHYPFFLIPSVLAKVLHTTTPHENALRGALRHLGYRATRSHAKAGSIKTDAPWSVIWQVMREWARQKSPIREGALKEGTAGWAIMKKAEMTEAAETGANGAPALKETVQREVVFDENLGKEKDGKKLVRYQRNPRENWGPMNRAKGHA
jgi:tRNA (guanine26-N2/guanine27-N2)-dimethyltransferase